MTKKIAATLAHHLVGLNRRKPTPRRGKHATVVALEGELGAGKTTFTQGFVRALGIREKVKSPTFLLIKNYKLKSKNFSDLYHIDCYRIHNWKELEPLEIKALLKDPNALVLIEWPERIRPILPKERVTVHIDHTAEKTRTIQITGL